MEIILAVLVAVQYLSGVSSTESGILMFIKAGTIQYLDNIWENADIADRINPYRHLLPVNKLLNDVYFRSPLIESWDTLEVTSVKLTFYNSEKEYMGDYHFKDNGFLDVDFLHSYLLQSYQNMIVETDFYYGPDIYIHSSGYDDRFSFMALHITNDHSPFKGNQFIMSANDHFNYLTRYNKSAEHVKCAGIQINTFINIEKVFQCTYYCLTVKNCMYYGIFSYKNSSSQQISRACVPLGKLPDYEKNECDSVCEDDWSCGKKYYTLPDSFAIADIYTLDPEVIKVLYGMTDDNIQDETRTYNIGSDHTVDLGSKVYIDGLKIEQGSGSFNVQIFQGSCIELVDGNLQTIEDWYLGFNNGEITTFEMSSSYLFAPVLARCLYFNSTDNLMGRRLSVRQVTSKFVLAEYMAVKAEWNKPVCSEMEVMSRKDIIPDHAIDITQFTLSFVNFSNGGEFTVPAISAGYIDVFVHDAAEFWVNNLEILVSVDAEITIKYLTYTNCTNQSTGNLEEVSLNDAIIRHVPANVLHRELFADLKVANMPAFCCEYLEIQVRADDPVVNSVFTVALNISGFFLGPGNLFSSMTPIQNLFDTNNVSVRAWFQPRPIVAFDALRPGGGGLMLGTIMEDISITIYLSMDVDIPVKSVELRGTLFAAAVDIGGETLFGSKYSSDSIVITFSNAAGKYVHIFDIQPATSTTYIDMTVRINACVMQSNSSNANLTAIYQSGPQTVSNTSAIYSSFTQIPPDMQLVTTTTTTTTYNWNTIASSRLGHLSVTTTTPHHHSTTTTNPLVNYPVTSTTQNHHSTTTTDQFINNLVSTATLNAFSTAINTPVNNPVLSATLTSFSTAINTPGNNPVPSATLNSFSIAINASVSNPVPSATLNSFSTAINTPVNNPVASATPNDFSTAATNSAGNLTVTPISTNGNQNGTNNPTSNAVSENTPHATTTKETTISLESTTASNKKEQIANKGCICSNATRNYTSEELKEVVKEIVKNLTIPVSKTSAFKRSKMSMPDERSSSAVIGAVGVASMVTIFGAVVAMDAIHIISAVNFIKSIIIKG